MGSGYRRLRSLLFALANSFALLPSLHVLYTTGVNCEFGDECE